MKKYSLLNILNRINHFKIFNTSLWPNKEILIKFLACIVIILFLILRIPHNQYQICMIQNNILYYNKLNTSFHSVLLNLYLKLGIIILENIILITYLIAYVTRTYAKNNAHTFMETAYPFLIAYLPIIISILPYNESIGYSEINSAKIQNLVLIIMLIGYVLNVTSLVTLRKSFAIMTEARYLIKKGVYRFIRHPAYLSHFIIFLGILILHFSLLSLVVYVIFITGQFIRAKMEEKKLIETYPDYITYKNYTGMFMPKCNYIFKYKNLLNNNE